MRYSYGMSFKAWDPADALARLAQEKEVIGDGEPVATATRIIRDAAPEAALAMTHLAIHSVDERMRFQAARYILDSTLNVGGKDSQQPIEQFLQSILDEADTSN